MEVETAFRRHLLGDATVQGYVAGKVSKWRLDAPVDQTGGRAIVVERNNGWATPDPVRSMEYPILRVKMYADVDRDDLGAPARANAEEKAWAVYRAVDPAMSNLVLRGTRVGAFGSDAGLMVVSCARRSEPMLVTMKDQHGQMSGAPLGDSVYVLAEYNLTVVH